MPMMRAGSRRSIGITPEQPHGERRLRRGGAAQHVADDAILDRHLNALRHARRRFAAALYGTQIVQRGAALAQSRHQDVRRGDRVLDRQVDADAADRRHRMRRIADAQQPGTKPGVQPVHRDGQQLHVVPRREFVHAVPQKRRKPHDVGAEGIQSARMHLVDAALWNDEGALPVVAAIQHDEDAAGIDVAERLSGIVRCFGQAQPQHVHRRADIRRPRSRRHRAASSGGHRRRWSVGRGSPDRRRGLRAVTPTMRSPSRIRPVASVLISRRNVGKRFAWSARKSRKSHCGMKAMNFACVGRWEKSAT